MKRHHLLCHLAGSSLVIAALLTLVACSDKLPPIPDASTASDAATSSDAAAADTTPGTDAPGDTAATDTTADTASTPDIAPDVMPSKCVASAPADGGTDGGSDGGADAALVGGTCNGHGTCDDSTGVAKCTCDFGFTGLRCETCNNPCSGKGTCDNVTGKCQCKKGYKGANCEKCDRDACSGQGKCVDTTGKPVCTCNKNYVGDDCENCDKGYVHWPPTSTRCIASPCDPDPCAGITGKAGSCTVTGPTSYSCDCATAGTPGQATIKGVKLDGKATLVKGALEAVKVEFQYSATKPASCTSGCRLQVVAGWVGANYGNDARHCIDVAASQCATGSVSVNLNAPAKAGAFDFHVVAMWKKDCAEAIDAFGLGTVGTKYAALSVDGRCRPDQPYVTAFTVDGSAKPAVVKPSQLIKISVTYQHHRGSQCPGCVWVDTLGFRDAAGAYTALDCTAMAGAYCPTITPMTRRTVTKSVAAPSQPGLHRINLSKHANYVSACGVLRPSTSPIFTVGMIRVQ